jgi:glycosyltransferase involved in cell wall biosynthesis
MTVVQASPVLSVADRSPSVDIAMPTRGNSPYVREAIESIFAQSFTSWRLVISENGMGNSGLRGALAELLDDPRVHHSVVGHDLSLAANWTRSIQDGSAPYVAMLHDDDRWSRDFLSKRVDFLAEHTECGFVFGGYRQVAEAGETLRSVIPSIPSGAIPQREALSILYEDCLVMPPTALVRRSAYDAVGPHFREIALPDHEMWIRLAAHADVGFLPVCDSDYRMHAKQNTSHIRSSYGKGQLEVVVATEAVAVPRDVRRRVHAKTHLLCAIDEAELGNRRSSLRHLELAVRSRPLSMARPTYAGRALLALLVIATGERGRRRYAAFRLRRHTKRITAA